MKKVFITIICAIFSNIVCSQVYYGKNNLGKLELINDSVYVASFYNENEIIFYDTGSYYKIGDTLFLNSEVKTPFILEEVSRGEGYDIEKEGGDIYHIIKFFAKTPENKGRYQMLIECRGYSIFYDSIKNELQFSGYVSSDEIIVIFDGWMYKRFRPFTYKKNGNVSCSNYKIKIIDDKVDRIYLDNFPLLIKKNKLVPIDKDKNEDCWINNGFYFPTMVRKKDNYTPKPYGTTIRVAYRGIIGLYPGYDY